MYFGNIPNKPRLDGFIILRVSENIDGLKERQNWKRRGDEDEEIGNNDKVEKIYNSKLKERNK